MNLIQNRQRTHKEFLDFYSTFQGSLNTKSYLSPQAFMINLSSIIKDLPNPLVLNYEPIPAFYISLQSALLSPKSVSILVRNTEEKFKLINSIKVYYDNELLKNRINIVDSFNYNLPYNYINYDCLTDYTTKSSILNENSISPFVFCTFNYFKTFNFSNIKCDINTEVIKSGIEFEDGSEEMKWLIGTLTLLSLFDPYNFATDFMFDDIIKSTNIRDIIPKQNKRYNPPNIADLSIIGDFLK